MYLRCSCRYCPTTAVKWGSGTVRVLLQPGEWTSRCEGVLLFWLRARTLALFGLAALMPMLAACAPSKPPSEPPTLVQTEPPSAEAPPDPGSALPEVRLLQ